MRAAQPTMTVVVANRLVEYAAARGLPRPRMYEILGVDEAVLGNLEQRVAASGLLGLYEYVMRELDDPALPVRLAESTRIENYQVMGFAAMTAPTGREAIARVIRYSGFVSDGGRYEFEEDDGRVAIRWVTAAPLTLGGRVSTERAICEFFGCMRQLHQMSRERPQVALDAGFRHAAPRDVSAHEQFFGCRVRFGADSNFFAVNADGLDRDQASSNPALHDFICRQAERLVPQLARPVSVADRAHAAIEGALASGEPSMPAIARQIGMSERSLRRHLTENGTTFRQLVDTVRRRRAETLLREPDVSVTDVAFLLGFSDSSAFSRAFRRWRGTSPRAFREAAAL